MLTGVAACTGSSDDSSEGGTQEAVNAAVEQTLIASTRLVAFQEASAVRQQVVLGRVVGNLFAASAAIAKPLPGLPDDLRSQAGQALSDLTSRLQLFSGCVDTPRPAVPPPASTGAPSLTGAGSATLPSCPTPQQADENAASAKATGLALARLRPYGSLSDSELSTLAQTVKQTSEQEARTGTFSDVPGIGSPTASTSPEPTPSAAP